MADGFLSALTIPNSTFSVEIHMAWVLCRLHAYSIIDLCQQGWAQFHECAGRDKDTVDEFSVLLLQVVIFRLHYITVQLISV